MNTLKKCKTLEKKKADTDSMQCYSGIVLNAR